MANKDNKANAAAPEATVEELMKQLAEERAAKEAAEKKAAEAEKAKDDAEAALAAKVAAAPTHDVKNADDSAAKAAEEKAYYNELVSIMLFKDNDKYKDDVFVAHNGRTYQIKRGVEVKVPRKVALILERSKEQDMQTANLIQQKEAELKAKEKALNI